MEINDLPDDVLLCIFLSLPLGSCADLFKFNLLLTCKRWRGILWTKALLQRISSFEYQSRFLIYHCLSNRTAEQSPFYRYCRYDPVSSTSVLTVNAESSSFREDIRNCPLVNMSISLWCCTLDHLSLRESTIFLLWHYHLGYIGFYRDSPNHGQGLVKCTYTQQHALQTASHMTIGEWYHIAIVIREKNDLKLYINGNRVGNWPLEGTLNRQNVSIAPVSTMWLASHCGSNKWHGSLSDLCVWKRPLEAYEIRELARTRTNIETIHFPLPLTL